MRDSKSNSQYDSSVSEFIKKVQELGLDRGAEAASAHHSNGTGTDYEAVVNKSDVKMAEKGRSSHANND